MESPQQDTRKRTTESDHSPKKARARMCEGGNDTEEVQQEESDAQFERAGPPPPKPVRTGQTVLATFEALNNPPGLKRGDRGYFSFEDFIDELLAKNGHPSLNHRKDPRYVAAKTLFDAEKKASDEWEQEYGEKDKEKRGTVV